MQTRRPVIRLRSAGGVVYRQHDGKVEVVLCGRTTPALWVLPKGTPDEGEQLEETALREVREETGLEVDIQSPLGSVNYWFVRTQDGTRCNKTVHFYLMTPTGGSLDLHDPEFDEVHWFPGEEALRIMTYPTEAPIVQKAIDLVSREAHGH